MQKNCIKGGFSLKNKGRKLIKIGKTTVKSALGFFWHDKTKIYVVKEPKEISGSPGFTNDDLHPMEELEAAFRESTFLRFVSWLDVGKGCIVRQGARKVTFDYGTEKSVIHIR